MSPGTIRWLKVPVFLLCLVPAFFIAGAIGVFVSQGSVMRYLGPDAKRPLAYGGASVAGIVLAVCSCSVLPMFAGIYAMGALVYELLVLLRFSHGIATFDHALGRQAAIRLSSRRIGRIGSRLRRSRVIRFVGRAPRERRDQYRADRDEENHNPPTASESRRHGSIVS